MQATTASPQAPVSHDVAVSLTALMRHLVTGTGRDFFKEVERQGLTFSQIKSLNLLAQQDPMTLKAISDEIGLSLPAISRGVDSLVKRGLVKRAEDPTDRRAKRVSLTAKGRSTFEGLLELRLAGIRAFVDGLEPAERDAIAEGLAPLMERPEIGALAPRRQTPCQDDCD